MDLVIIFRELTPIMFPLMSSIKGDSVSVLADGCVELATDLAIPTCLTDVGIKVRKKIITQFKHQSYLMLISGF